MTETTNTAPESRATSAGKRGVPAWVQIIVWGLLIALLAIVFVGLRRAQQGTVQPGDKIPDFTLPLFSGYEYEGRSEVKLSDFRGKVVVLNFWASWCKPCEQEAAELQEAWQFYEPDGKVVFLGADYVDTEPEARVYLKKFGITFANGPDMGTKISQMFRIKGVPETYFIDQNGVLQYVKVGPFSSVDEIKSIIDGLLK
ncbi:MAG: TlpA family protein disulfide reductase [Chloroflexi bacterium]|nr:TlpA family protein disulfide reductase [Chloroflexota bacterium]